MHGWWVTPGCRVACSWVIHVGHMAFAMSWVRVVMHVLIREEGLALPPIKGVPGPPPLRQLLKRSRTCSGFNHVCHVGFRSCQGGRGCSAAPKGVLPLCASYLFYAQLPEEDHNICSRFRAHLWGSISPSRLTSVCEGRTSSSDLASICGAGSNQPHLKGQAIRLVFWGRI
jgi:hypothetical protein